MLLWRVYHILYFRLAQGSADCALLGSFRRVPWHLGTMGPAKWGEPSTYPGNRFEA